MERQVLLLHDNARLHSSKQTAQKLASLGYTVSPHPPFSVDLVSSDYALFNKMKEPLHRRKLPTSETGREISMTMCTVPPKTGMLLLSKVIREMATVHRP
jgi:transposase